MKILILAGGDGSRVRPYTDIMAKCLLPVNGVPCVRRILDDLRKQLPDTEIILCINRRFEPQYRHEFRDVDLTFSVTKEPAGTAGEIDFARDLIGDDQFMVVYGDDLTEINYYLFWTFHNSSEKATATLALSPSLSLEVGLVDLRKNIIVEIKEKPTLKKAFWIGKCILEPQVLPYCKPNLDLAKDVFPSLIKEGHILYGYVNDSLWLDIGNIRYYEKANEHYRNKDLGA